MPYKEQEQLFSQRYKSISLSSLHEGQPETNVMSARNIRSTSRDASTNIAVKVPKLPMLETEVYADAMKPKLMQNRSLQNIQPISTSEIRSRNSSAQYTGLSSLKGKPQYFINKTTLPKPKQNTIKVGTGGIRMLAASNASGLNLHRNLRYFSDEGSNSSRSPES